MVGTQLTDTHALYINDTVYNTVTYCSNIHTNTRVKIVDK